MPPDLLLTGATGFIGYYISHALAAMGRSFSALVRPSSDTTYLREIADHCTLIEGDINDPESLFDAFTDVDTVIHAAAMVSYQSGDEDEMLKINGEGTANVVNMMLQSGCRRLVYVSSVAALDRVNGGRPIAVTDHWPRKNPNTAYARSKFAAEREVWRGRAEGLSVAAAYPSVVLGAGDWLGQNTPALWRMAAKGSLFYPEGAAGFVDVRDVARAILFLLDRKLDGDRFLLSAANMSWHELQRRIADSIGAEPPKFQLADWQSSLLWPMEALRSRLTGKRPLITRESNRTVQSNYRYDGAPFAKITGCDYLPVETTIQEIGKAFLLARSQGDPLPTIHLPVV